MELGQRWKVKREIVIIHLQKNTSIKLEEREKREEDWISTWSKYKCSGKTRIVILCSEKKSKFSLWPLSLHFKSSFDLKQSAHTKLTLS
jgi:hypothetical protein